MDRIRTILVIALALAAWTVSPCSAQHAADQRAGLSNITTVGIERRDSLHSRALVPDTAKPHHSQLRKILIGGAIGTAAGVWLGEQAKHGGDGDGGWQVDTALGLLFGSLTAFVVYAVTRSQ